LLPFLSFFTVAFDRAKTAENAPLTHRGDLLERGEKPYMHFTKEKHSFGGRFKMPSMTNAFKMNLLFIFTRRLFFFPVHNEAFQTLKSSVADYTRSI